MKTTRILIAITALLFSGMTHAGLRPFTSDGCSSAPDGLQSDTDYLNCCVNHDVAYWKGGTLKEKVKADAAFHQCMSENASSLVSWVYLQAVAVGGSANLNMSWTWGYGWKPLRGYKALTTSDKEVIKMMEPNFRVPLPLVKTYSLAPITIARIKNAILEQYNFVPTSVSKIYRVVLFLTGTVYDVTSVPSEENLMLITRASCPQGHYRVNGAEFKATGKLKLVHYGNCPAL